MGRLFSYQERTGASLHEIMNMPYIQFIIGMVDCPHIDYDTKKEINSVSLTAEQQAEQLINILS